MAEYRWNKLKLRLSNIIAPNIDISFNYSPVRKKTDRSEIIISFFQVKLDGEIIWRFPKDTNQQINGSIFFKEGELLHGKGIEYPIMSIIKYLDLPKDQILDYEDKAGLADVLKVCDRRIGFNRLKNLELLNAAKKIFDARFKNKQRIEKKSSN
jgi:hypothetical protein